MTVKQLQEMLAAMPSDAIVKISSQTGGWMIPYSVYEIDENEVRID